MKTQPFSALALFVSLSLLLSASGMPVTAGGAQLPRLSGPESLDVPGDIELSKANAVSDSAATVQPSNGARVSAAQSEAVMFIENVGQFDASARFQVRGGDRTVWLAEDAIWVTVLEKPDKGTTLETAQGQVRQGDKETFAESIRNPQSKIKRASISG
jgi:hypothetical protein